jgi:hypothetical protein
MWRVIGYRPTRWARFAGDSTEYGGQRVVAYGIATKEKALEIAEKYNAKCKPSSFWVEEYTKPEKP